MSLRSLFGGSRKKTLDDLIRGDAVVTLTDLLELDELQCHTDIVAAGEKLLQNPKHSHDGYDILGYLAVEGDVNAQFILGGFCEEALCRPEQAATWFQRAADQGHPQAQRNYADLLMTGKGIARDTRLASKYYEKAAESGIAEAQFVMGELLRVGVHVPQNLEESRKWYTLALQNGYQAAQTRLEQMASGVGVQARTEPAVTAVVYESLGDVPREQLMAQGLEYFIGDNRPQDLKKAAECVELAAKKNLSAAQYMIGKMYMGGQGVSKNYEKALFWLKMATDQDHPEAAFEVAKFYDRGIVVSKNAAVANDYLKKAASLGHKLSSEALMKRRMNR